MICFGYYNLDGKMFADEITTDTTTAVTSEQITPQEASTETPPTEVSTQTEQALSPDNTITTEANSGEISENIIETGNINIETGIVNNET